MPTAAALSLFAVAMSFPRSSASSRPNRFAPISPPAPSDMRKTPCAGDWFLLDEEMDKALRFSGYDHFFRIINGGHVGRLLRLFSRGDEFYLEGLAQAGSSRAQVRRVCEIMILPDEKWQMVGQRGWHDARGPVCNANGEVFFVDAPGNKIYRIDRAGKVKRVPVRCRSCQRPFL